MLQPPDRTLLYSYIMSRIRKIYGEVDKQTGSFVPTQLVPSIHKTIFPSFLSHCFFVNTREYKGQDRFIIKKYTVLIII